MCKRKSHRETFRGDRYAHYLDIVVMVSWVYTYVWAHQTVYIKYVVSGPSIIPQWNFF